MFAHEYCYTLDQFLGLTMLQVIELRKSIERRKVIDRYPMQKFLASLHRAKVKDLEEILGEISPHVFDSETDKLLEKRAFEKLEEMRKAHAG